MLLWICVSITCRCSMIWPHRTSRPSRALPTVASCCSTGWREATITSLCLRKASPTRSYWWSRWTLTMQYWQISSSHVSQYRSSSFAGCLGQGMACFLEGTSFAASLVSCWIVITSCEESSFHVWWTLVHPKQMNWPQLRQKFTAFSSWHLSHSDSRDSVTFLRAD